jgi:hypothetical protein
VGLWSDESAGMARGLDNGHRFESAMSKMRGFKLCGKWVGWSG